MFCIPYLVSLYCCYLALQDYSRSITEKRALASAEGADMPAVQARYMRALEMNTRWGLIGFALYGFHYFYSVWNGIFGCTGLFQIFLECAYCVFVKQVLMQMDANIDRLPEFLAFIGAKKDQLLAQVPPQARSTFGWVMSIFNSASSGAVGASSATTDKRKLK